MEKGRELESRLIQDIKTTGYPSEILAGNIFINKGWQVDLNKYYFDWDEKKGREVDLVAFEMVRSKKYDISIDLYLITQVKKSDKYPWVIFSTEAEGIEEPGWSRLHIAYDQINSEILPVQKLEEKSSVSNFKRFGHSYYEGFKGETSKSNIFDALASAVKASEDCLRHLNEMDKEEEERLGRDVRVGRHVTFIEPLVIIDGLLYEAYLDNKNELVINSTNCMAVCFGYLSSEYKRSDFYGNYLIEIVTMNGLSDFIDIKMNWLNSLKRNIVKNINKQ